MEIGATISDQEQSAENAAASVRVHAGASASRLSRIWASALDLVLPPLCLACDGPIADHDCLCPGCWRQIRFIRQPLCDHLGLPLPYDTGGPMLSAAAAADPQAFDRARAVAVFDGPMRQLIHAMKFHDNHNARRLFGRWLSEAGKDLLADAELIVPIPLSRSRLLFRRFNQSQILSLELARTTGLGTAPLALRRARRTHSQVGLTRLERKRNVAGAFAVTPHGQSLIAGKSIVLVDDVITTGATVSAAARALKAKGAARVDVLALALVCDQMD